MLSDFLHTVTECGTLPVPEPGPGNLTLVQNSTNFDTTAVYSCQEPGYLLVGDAQRTCGRDGNYNGTEPMCECR